MLAESEQHQLITDALIQVDLAGLDHEDVPGALLRALLEQGWTPPAAPVAESGAHACVPPRDRTMDELWAGNRHYVCSCGLRWSFLRYRDSADEKSGEWRCYGR